MGVLRSSRPARPARPGGRSGRVRAALGDGVLDGMVLAPVAAALVVVLAGTGTTPGTSDSAGSAAGTEVLATQASVTEVRAGSATGELRPAVRVAATAAAAGATGSVSEGKVAGVLLAAYRSAAGSVPTSCNLQVSLLAAIGEVESGSLAGRPLDSRHRTSVLGPVLDGNGFASIPDTDDGRWDGDTTWDRAMGPMQFVPSTWRSFGVDGDADGVAHPQDVEDAAASAAAYLCYGGRDLARPDELRSAILSYNHSTAYEKLVMTYQQRYAALGLDSGVTATLLPTVGAAVSATPVGGLGSALASPVTSAGGGSGKAARPRKAAAPRPGASRQPSARGPRTPSPAGTPARTPSADRGPARAPATGPSPTGNPSGPPSRIPGETPGTPSGTPSRPPTGTPSGTPSKTPTGTPSGTPSKTPTGTPSGTPSKTPTGTPSGTPTKTPTGTPSGSPTDTPTGSPTCPPVTPGAELTAAIPAAPGEDGPVLTCPPCPGSVSATPPPDSPDTDEVCVPGSETVTE